MNDEYDRFHALHEYRLYLTPDHECSYLPDKKAVTLFVDPHAPMTNEAYSQFSELGFRRSGDNVYRPHCRMCHECKAVRILANYFTPNRSQRRCLKLNEDCHTQWVAAEYKTEHFNLYHRYTQSRHSGSNMSEYEPEQYQQLIQTDWCDTRLLEIYHEDHLIAVAITDWLTDGLSAVYTFFDPELNKRSLGNFAIMQQIAAARDTGRDYLYLGYWIKGCQKMAYKNQFSLYEIFDDDGWDLQPLTFPD